jgi:phospholipase C
MIRFIEDNWLGGERIGQGSFDTISTSIATMLTFIQSSTCVRTVILDDNTGEVVSKGCSSTR